MADRYLLESGSPDGYLLEDGTGVLLIDAITTLAFTDNFDDNSISASWTAGNFADPTATTTGVTVSETSQQLQVTGPASTAAVRYSGLISAATYDVTDSAIFVKVVNVASQQGSEISYLGFGTDVSNHYAIVLSTSGGLHLDFQRMVGGSATTVGQVFLSTDVWFRIHHLSNGDRVLVDTAPSTASDPPAEGDWVNRLSETRNTTALVLATAKVAFGGGLFGSIATPTTIQFDGFNTATTGAAAHATTGVLTGPGSTVAGTAAHIAIHATSGVLTGPGSTISGTAAHIAIHATSGALTGPGSAIVGSAARTREHVTSGILTGPGSTIAGVAVYNAKHTTSGTLTGPGSTVAGTASRFRAFATSGVLIGPGSTIVGAALRGIIATTHATSGALVGQPSIILGTAARMRQHGTSGILVGPPALVVGVNTRWRDHGSSGALLGVTGFVFGRAFNGTPQLHDIPVDSDNLTDEPASPSANLGPITEPSGQIVNHPPYPPA